MKTLLSGLAIVIALTAHLPSAFANDVISPSGNVTNAVQVNTIDLNTASVNELTMLPGVGLAKAEAIIRYREEVGPFLEVAQLTQVKGIGEKMLMKIEKLVSVQ
ncbi:hypothetical protein D210916BOD24_23970 [Alteromonas sp. D210916BOD_24]|uniref:ComEA family DNA-binding protein n=1 Tax=Alteromonas sp. D210916BOD_24 TaxID=3157618 RepID=UPI00399D524D